MKVSHLLKSLKFYISVIILIAAYALSYVVSAYGPLRNGLMETILDENGGFLYNLDRFPAWCAWSFAPVIIASAFVYIWAFIHLSKALSCRKLERRNMISGGVALVIAFLFIACATITASVLGRITAAGFAVTVTSIAFLIGAAHFVCIRFFTPLPN